ncbi:MAG: nitroreductase family protein [Candidatus Binatia bacterium]
MATATTAGRVSQVIEVPEGAEWNAVEEAMLRRRSIRKYKSRQVPDHVIRRLLEVARYAPSQGNCQPWKFVVIRDRAMIQEMEDHCVGMCRKLSRNLDYTTHPPGSVRRFVTRAAAKLCNYLQPNMLHPVPIFTMTAIAEGRFAVFHKAPTVILLLADTRGVGSPDIDVGICGTNIVLAAQSLGLGTCWVGFSKFLGRSREWRARLGIEDPYELSEAITVGYPIGNPTRLVSRETHEIAWFEDAKKTILY